jgi:translation initiation factor IF-2
MAEIRLNKIIRTYNIGLQSLVDFLTSKGVEVEANPNAKISDEHLPAIEKQFGKDLEMKQASEKVDIKLTEILEKTSRKQQEKTQEDDFEEPVKETVIKSNVFTPSTPKPAPVPEPEPEPVVPEPEPEVQEEPVVETPVVDSPEVPEPDHWL